MGLLIFAKGWKTKRKPSRTSMQREWGQSRRNHGVRISSMRRKAKCQSHGQQMWGPPVYLWRLRLWLLRLGLCCLARFSLSLSSSPCCLVASAPFSKQLSSRHNSRTSSATLFWWSPFTARGANCCPKSISKPHWFLMTSLTCNTQ